MIKWIAAFIGSIFWRFPGAIAGFILGYLLETYLKSTRRSTTNNRPSPEPRRYVQSNFELNLLSLAALVIKADGKISQHELDYVRLFFVRQFGKDRANASFRIFNDEIKRRNLSLSHICNHLRAFTNYETRLQILHFLFGIADADSRILHSELHVLQEIAKRLNINRHDFYSIHAMFHKTKSISTAYTILKISENASEEEIKQAYRNMVKKYHPDRLTGMDETYIKGAREKFEKVQEAYEQIRKERGF